MAGSRWLLLYDASAGLRMSPAHGYGSAVFTWSDLLRAPLSDASVYVLYFPSRFGLPVDDAVFAALAVFGANTSERTSVNGWDPTDEYFSEALDLFGVRSPPALVLITGLHGATADLKDSLYCVSFTDSVVLGERSKTAEALNIAHEVLMRCDRKEIAGYLRGRRADALLRAIGRGTGAVRDELLRLHPKFGLPGGLTVELGS
jgi:hypothetical protein